MARKDDVIRRDGSRLKYTNLSHLYNGFPTLCGVYRVDNVVKSFNGLW